jgi:hypothetical protein
MHAAGVTTVHVSRRTQHAPRTKNDGDEKTQ